MPDLSSIKAPLAAMSHHVPDPPDPDLVYANYLKTCRRSGVEPVSREHAAELIAEWSDVIALPRTNADVLFRGQE